MRQKKKSAEAVDSALNTVQAYENGLLSVDEALAALKVSRATFHRWRKTWRETGTLQVHGNAGKAPSNKVPDEVRQQVVELINTRYSDFQATLLQKYLAKEHDIKVSVEWVRRLLKELRPDESSTIRRQSAHRLRRRRASRGQLVQIDGSPHQWFEGDETYYCLIIFVDDATNEILAGGFFPTETTQAYVDVLRQVIAAYGMPVALYSDRHSIFTQNIDPTAGRRKAQQKTQFNRICDQLGIEMILAHSPQAKGRIERAFRTLQGRWPKEFRILGIKTMAEANARMAELLGGYNREFSIAPADPKDSFVPLTPEQRDELEFIFGTWHRKTISVNLTVSNGPNIIQIEGVSSRMRMAMKKTDCQLVEFSDGRIELYWFDEVEWRKQCAKSGREERKIYHKLQFHEVERWDRRPGKQDYKEPASETSKTVDAHLDEVIKKRRSPWHDSMGRWVEKAERKKAEREKKQEEAKKVEERLAAAKKAVSKP